MTAPLAPSRGRVARHRGPAPLTHIPDARRAWLTVGSVTRTSLNDELPGS
jgi:hypothetical protein